MAGNQIDLGIIDEIDIEGTIREVLAEGLRLNDYEEFRNDLAEAKSSLIRWIMPGRSFFDRILLEEIARSRI